MGALGAQENHCADDEVHIARGTLSTGIPAKCASAIEHSSPPPGTHMRRKVLAYGDLLVLT